MWRWHPRRSTAARHPALSWRPRRFGPDRSGRMAIRRFVRAASVETGQQLVDVFLAGPAARQGRPLQQIEAVALLRPRRRRPGRPERLDQGLDLALDVLEDRKSTRLHS